MVLPGCSPLRPLGRPWQPHSLGRNLLGRAAWIGCGDGRPRDKALLVCSPLRLKVSPYLQAVLSTMGMLMQRYTQLSQHGAEGSPCGMPCGMPCGIPYGMPCPNSAAFPCVGSGEDREAAMSAMPHLSASCLLSGKCLLSSLFEVELINARVRCSVFLITSGQMMFNLRELLSFQMF